MNPVKQQMVWCVVWSFAGLVVFGGCSRDVRLTGRKVRDVTVGSVTHYGVTLDKSATPARVAYVLLRAIQDDFRSATPEDRDAAIDRQFDLAAADSIQARNRIGIPRAEFIFNVVNRWTPTVSHYADDFETDFDAAKARFRVSPPRDMAGSGSESKQCQVMMEVRGSAADPTARAVMIVWMAQDAGYWRVIHLGFDTRRKIEDRS